MINAPAFAAAVLHHQAAFAQPADPLEADLIAELSQPAAETNHLEQLFKAERYLRDVGYTEPIRRTRALQHGSSDVAERRRRDKRRAQAKQAARRLKAGRS